MKTNSRARCALKTFDHRTSFDVTNKNHAICQVDYSELKRKMIFFCERCKSRGSILGSLLHFICDLYGDLSYSDLP